MKEIDVTQGGAFVLDFVEDTYVVFPKTGSYEVTHNGQKIVSGIITIPSGYFCLSDIAKSFYKQKIDEPRVKYSIPLTVRFSGTDGSSSFVVVSFKNTYIKEDVLTQDWCWENVHYCFSAYDPMGAEFLMDASTKDGQWVYEQIVDADPDEMANFFVGEEGKEGGGQMMFYKDEDPISPMITVKPCIGYAIHYLNPAGGWSTYCIPEPREKKQFNRTCSVFRKFKKDIKNITSRSWECQSGALEKRNADKFWMLLESTELYLETPDQELIPVRVTTSD